MPSSYHSDTPLRMPLRDDAVDGIVAHLNAVAAEVSAWERVSRGTAHPA